MNKLTVIILMCLGLMACKKETTTPASTTPTNGNTLSGVWNYIHIVNNIPYNCNWTFNNDGTMVINDEYDGFNGQTITYSYDSSSKKLTIGGLVVNQLTWESSTKFTTFAYNRNTEFTKSNTTSTNTNFTSSFDFTFDGKKYSWTGEYTDGKPCAVYSYSSKKTTINLFNPNNPLSINTIDPKPYAYTMYIKSLLNKVGTEINDSTLNNTNSSISFYVTDSINPKNIYKYSDEKIVDSKGYSKINITQYDTINHILKGNLIGVFNDFGHSSKKTISGTFSVYLKTEK